MTDGLPNPGQETDRIVGFRQLKNALEQFSSDRTQPAWLLYRQAETALTPTKTNERINMMATRLSMFLTVLASAVLNDVPSVT